MLCNVFVSSQPWLFSSILYNFFSNSWINFEAFYFLNIWRFVTILCYWFLISLYCHQKRGFVCLWYLFIFSLCPNTWSSFIHSLYICKECIFSNCWVQGPLDPLYCLNLLCSYNILCVCFTSYLDVFKKKSNDDDEFVHFFLKFCQVLLYIFWSYVVRCKPYYVWWNVSSTFTQWFLEKDI